MKIAGWLALGIAVLLLGAALLQYKNDANDAFRAQEMSLAIKVGVAAEMSRLSAEEAATMQVIRLEALAGAAFLVAGLALVLSGRRRTQMAAATPSLQS